MTGGVCGAGDAGQGGRGLHRGWDKVQGGHGREGRHHRGLTADKLTRVSADQSTSTELTIVTAEGDRVTLSGTTTAHLGYAGYSHLGASKGGAVAVQGEAATAAVSQQVQLTVQGDLSDQERADIEKLVGLLAQGDVKGALEQAQQGGDLGSLAGFSLSVDQSTRIQVATAERLQTGVAA
jgi:hypothetical protein